MKRQKPKPLSSNTSQLDIDLNYTELLDCSASLLILVLLQNLFMQRAKYPSSLAFIRIIK